MTVDEGYIKYRSDWTLAPAPDLSATVLLEIWRRPLYEARLVGHYADLNVGFGNISIRYGKQGQFIISGTQTGHLPVTGNEHYAFVTNYDIAANRVSCTGPVQASSESLTHANLYELDPNINAVVHVHSKALWKKLRDRVPTTSEGVAYGTPEMASEFVRLYRDTDFCSTGIAVMAGHDEGLVSIGTTLEQAAKRILRINQDLG